MTTSTDCSMPRTEVYQLRLTTEEKADLARQAREADLSIAGLIRRWAGLSGASPARKAPIPSDLTDRMIAAVVGKPDPFKARVDELTRTMPRSNAERLARKELR